MSMVLCHLCEAFIDSDDFPEGFYTKGYPDKYVCDNCVENNELEREI